MSQVVDWIDTHPRTLAYIALVVTADLTLNIVQAIT